MTKRKIEYWVIPPEQDAEFVACMEEVLETSAVYLRPAAKYRELTHRSSQEQKGLDERAVMPSQRPSHP